jgi:2-C-methyl-D-erythritol 4-phosphate cytidylyltransferase
VFGRVPSASMTTAAIVLAGGSGTRSQQIFNKVYIPIRERPMLAYSLETFDRSESVGRLVLVIRDDDRQVAERVLAETPISKPTAVVAGGASRHQSEQAGLLALANAIETGEIDLVAIHDGARPFMTLELLEQVIGEARAHGGAVPGMPVEPPLYRISETMVEPLSSDTLRLVQTPQVFRAAPLLAAYRKAAEVGFEGVDTAETVERFSDLEVALVAGDPRNLKITFIEDFFEAEDWAEMWDKGGWRVRLPGKP